MSPKCVNFLCHLITQHPVIRKEIFSPLHFAKISFFPDLLFKSFITVTGYKDNLNAVWLQGAIFILYFFLGALCRVWQRKAIYYFARLFFSFMLSPSTMPFAYLFIFRSFFYGIGTRVEKITINISYLIQRNVW